MLPIPLHHVLAFRRFLTCFLAQCTLVLAPDIFIMKQFSETRPTGLVLVPSACNILIDNFASSLHKQAESLRYVEIGSGLMSVERLHALQMILPTAQIHLTYGLTEGRVGYLVRGPDGVFDRLDRMNHGIEINVVDRDGRQVRVGQTGEILISGSGLFKGYWGDSFEVQAALETRGFRTGDMGVVDENGRVRLMGRLDDIIKVGGHKIHPREIETILQGHPSVEEVIVAKHSDGNGMESSLRAYVVRKRGFVVSDAELIAYCREHLELYKVPASILFRESLPKTSLGKIQRRMIA
jgi:long-chain acyl-CoA synthetase